MDGSGTPPPPSRSATAGSPPSGCSGTPTSSPTSTAGRPRLSNLLADLAAGSTVGPPGGQRRARRARRAADMQRWVVTPPAGGGLRGGHPAPSTREHPGGRPGPLDGLPSCRPEPRSASADCVVRRSASRGRTGYSTSNGRRPDETRARPLIARRDPPGSVLDTDRQTEFDVLPGFGAHHRFRRPGRGGSTPTVGGWNGPRS